MIPGLSIPRNFQLVTKPSYLNRLIRRHAPISLLPNDVDDDNSTSNEDKSSSAPEKSSFKPSLLSPAVVLEKCDPLLTKQQQSNNLEYPKSCETAEIISTANYEPNIDGGSEGEADMILEENTGYSPTITHNCCQPPSNEPPERITSNVQSRTTLLTVAVTSNEMLQNRSNDASGQEFAIVQNGTVNNIETTSTPMQPLAFQSNEPQRVENFDSASINQSNAHQVTNSTKMIESNQEDIMNLPLSTASKSSQDFNCDWEELLDKYQTTIRKRQRANKRIILKRERAHLMKVNQLKSMVNVLKKANQKLNANMQKMEGQMKNAVEETKRKKWCWNCQIELKYVVASFPMCKDCINRNW